MTPGGGALGSCGYSSRMCCARGTPTADRTARTPRARPRGTRPGHTSRRSPTAIEQSASFRGTPSVRGRSRPGPGANGFQPGVTNRSSPASTSVADASIPRGSGSETAQRRGEVAAGSGDASGGRANGLSMPAGGSGPGGSRSGRVQPGGPGEVAAALRVLPVVAGAMVEPRDRRTAVSRRTRARPGHRRSAGRAWCGRSDAEAEALDDRVHVRPGVGGERRVPAAQDEHPVIPDREQVDPQPGPTGVSPWSRRS